MHVFKYSPRKGTRAAVMLNQVDGKIKEERSSKLIELSNKNEKEFLDNYINKKVEVLFEQKENGYFKGHTTNYIIVKAKGKNLDNEIKQVEIEKKDKLELIAKYWNINVIKMKHKSNVNVTKKLLIKKFFCSINYIRFVKKDWEHI